VAIQLVQHVSGRKQLIIVMDSLMADIQIGGFPQEKNLQPCPIMEDTIRQLIRMFSREQSQVTIGHPRPMWAIPALRGLCISAMVVCTPTLRRITTMPVV
jgi:hypothetical protein